MSNISSVRLVSDLEYDSVSNGEGLRMVLWFQGCFYGCKGCHNPESWDIDGGKVYPIKDILKKIKDNATCDGITLSGGDPLLQIEALKVLLPAIKALNLNVWLYTGDIYENLINNKDFKVIAPHIDVLVDGPFVLSQLDLNLTYRGSSNQRLIDMQKSLAKGLVVDYILD